MLALLTLPPGCGLQMWQACTWFQINKKLLGNFKKFEPKHSQHFYQLNSLPPATAWQELILLHCSGLYQVSWSLQNAVDGSHTTVMTNCICLYRCLLPLSAWVKACLQWSNIISRWSSQLPWWQWCCYEMTISIFAHRNGQQVMGGGHLSQSSKMIAEQGGRTMVGVLLTVDYPCGINGDDCDDGHGCAWQ